MLKKILGILLSSLLAFPVLTPALAQTQGVPFTVVSRVGEAGPRVVALAIDAGKPLPINWSLAAAFTVNAELLPINTYAGDPIANSAVAKSPRTIRRAYTSATPEIGSPAQGRYVIVEMDADDGNAASWYLGFNPSIRQLIPYSAKMVYEVKLLHDLNFVAPDVSPTKPGATTETLKAGSTFRQAGARVLTAEKFTQDVLEMPSNAQTKFLGYNFYKPEVQPGAKVPLVVFLHGSGQSHDYKHFPTDFKADVLSPLLANQGGVAWVERAKEKAFVLVPQAPARDTADSAGERGWRSADTQKLLLALVDKVIAENPAIDTQRLYLTGLSMGAMGSWKIITNPDSAVSRKFASAVLFNGGPRKTFGSEPGETLEQMDARIAPELKQVDFRPVAIPLWLGHGDTDPVVTRAGSRVPFAQLTGKARTDAAGALLPEQGVLKTSSALVRLYAAANRFHGTEVRYTEYQYGNGEPFRELGMVTRHGHFTWEAGYKDQAIIEWMFAQRKVTAAP